MSLRTRILALGLLAVIALLYILFDQVTTELTIRSAKQELLVQTTTTEKIGELLHTLQRERGLSIRFLTFSPSRDGQELHNQRTITDQKAEQLFQTQTSSRELFAELIATRQRIDARQETPEAVLLYFSSLIASLLDHFTPLGQNSSSPLLQSAIRTHDHLLHAMESLGLLRATLMAKNFQNSEILQIGRYLGLFDCYQHQALQSAPASLGAALRSALADSRIQAVRELTRAIVAEPSRAIQENPHERRFDLVSAALETLRPIEQNSLRQLHDQAHREISAAEERLVRHLLIILTISFLLIALVTGAILQILRALGLLLNSVTSIISSQDFSNRVAMDNPQEMSIISQGFNTLLELAERLIKEKDFLATSDPLTSVFNRRKFNELFARHLELEDRHHHGLAVILIDIDHFKQINDQFGHPVGDRVLQGFAQMVQSHMRHTDLFARWGGEEFIIAIPTGGDKAAGNLAEKLRYHVEHHLFPEAIQVTASFGVAAHVPGDTLEKLSQRADQALYAAKKGGRNRVVLWNPDHPMGTSVPALS